MFKYLREEFIDKNKIKNHLVIVLLFCEMNFYCTITATKY